MPFVEGGELGLSETLHDRENGCVDESDIRVGIAITKLADTAVVIGHQGFDLVRTGTDVVQESDKDPCVEPGVNPVVELHQHGCRNDKRLVRILDELPTCCMIGVAPIQSGVERTGVEDQRHDRGVGRSSPARRPVSEWPEAPIPRLRGFGR